MGGIWIIVLILVYGWKFLFHEIVSFPTNLRFGEVRLLARDFNLVLPLQLEAPDGIHEIHQQLDRGGAKRASGADYAGPRGINQKALGSYGLASIHRSGLDGAPRAYSWLTNLLLLPSLS